MVDVNVEDKNRVIIIQIDGAFYMDTIPQMEKIWDEQIEKEPEVIAINCLNLQQIDSAAIGHLVKYLNHAMANNIKLIFYNLHNQIQQLFITAKLHRFFSITSQQEFEQKYLLTA